MPISRVDPMAVDFNALRTMVLVFDTGSFSLAADRLYVNQSTVSYTIDRLRKAFHDPLFVRQGMGIAATDRCHDVVASVREMIETYQDLSQPRDFDPGAATGLISISCNYYERLIVLPSLMRLLRKEAPGLTVMVHQAFGAGGRQLKQGDSDFLMGPVRFNDAGLYKRRILNDKYVCVMDAANPLAQGLLDLDSYLGACHAVVTYGGNWRSNYLLELEARGLSLNQVLGVPSPADLGQILRGTDLISTLPSRMAAVLMKDVVVRPCPLPSPFEIDLVWTARTHHSAMHRWVRHQIAQIAADVPDVFL